MAPALSIALITQDAQAIVGAAIESVHGIADEVVVVDGGSRDATRDVVRAFPKVRLVERAFPGSIADQKNFAFEQCKGEWVLCIDSDERLGPLGRTAVARATLSRKAAWFKLPRYWLVREAPPAYVDDGRLLYPDWQLRLFRNQPYFRYAADRSVHHRFPKKGRPPGRKLPFGHIFHLDFLLNDRARREAKVARYKQVAPAEAATHEQYLYEDRAHRVLPCAEAMDGPAAPGLVQRLRLAWATR